MCVCHLKASGWSRNGIGEFTVLVCDSWLRHSWEGGREGGRERGREKETETEWKREVGGRRVRYCHGNSLLLYCYSDSSRLHIRTWCTYIHCTHPYSPNIIINLFMPIPTHAYSDMYMYVLYYSQRDFPSDTMCRTLTHVRTHLVWVGCRSGRCAGHQTSGSGQCSTLWLHVPVRI